MNRVKGKFKMAEDSTDMPQFLLVKLVLFYALQSLGVAQTSNVVRFWRS